VTSDRTLDPPAGSLARPRRRLRLALVLLLVGVLTASGAVWTNAFGAGDRFERLRDRIELALDPPPDRPTRVTVEVTPPVTAVEPGPTATAQPPSSASPGAKPAATPRTTPSPTPAPVRKPVDVRIVDDPEAVFAHQLDKHACAVAGTQMVLAVLGLGDNSDGFQRTLAGRIDEWESWEDSHNGGWGPASIAEALAAYGAPEYEIRAYGSRAHALRDSAIALKRTGKPVVLIAWRGAHTWIMTGYRANADPTIFPDAKVTGTYVLDPWYPWVSNIWGPSDPPGTFQDMAEMQRNYLPWARPEGRYPDRDGKFIALVPTAP
jgi:hypothetical protein